MDTTQITPEQAEALYKEAVAVVAPEHTPAPPPKYFIRTDEDRMMKISIKVMRELKTSADTVVIADVLANFVWNGQEYLPYAEAQALLDNLNNGQILELAQVLDKRTELAAIPLANGAG